MATWRKGWRTERHAEARVGEWQKGVWLWHVWERHSERVIDNGCEATEAEARAEAERVMREAGGG
jgi:hypothetical protein